MKMGCEWNWISLLIYGFCINNSVLSNASTIVVGRLVIDWVNYVDSYKISSFELDSCDTELTEEALFVATRTMIYSQTFSACLFSNKLSSTNKK